MMKKADHYNVNNYSFIQAQALKCRKAEVSMLNVGNQDIYVFYLKLNTIACTHINIP